MKILQPNFNMEPDTRNVFLETSNKNLDLKNPARQ